MLFVLLLSFLLLYLLFRALSVSLSVPRYRHYWLNRNRLPFRAGQLRLVALGDSVVQGIGASRADKGLVGLVAQYIAEQTGKEVHVQNISRSGARVEEVADRMVAEADIRRADLILVVASANDALKHTPLDVYERSLEKLLAALPKDRTIIADVPHVRRRERYQEVLERVVGARGFTHVGYEEVMRHAGRSFRYVAGDFLHPNDKGYEDLWFGSFRPFIDQHVGRLKTGAK